MAPTIKLFTYPMKLEEITGQRILTSTREADENSLNTELFVKNVPTDTDEDELIPFFEQVGPLQTLRLMMNEKKTENRGYVYITYLRNNDSNIAISALHGKEIRRFRPVSVELSLNNCRIFIGGIAVNKSKDQVWQELIKQGVQDIVDVIMYRSYNNRAENRGFVFVEFPSHKLAAKMRCRNKDLLLWGNKVIVDWSVPQPEISEDVMAKVKILYLRNLSVMEPREELKKIVERYVDASHIEKLYKFKNYAFVHVSSRILAEELLRNLRDYYKYTHVEVTFAKPPNHYTQPEFRKHQMSKTMSPRRIKSPDVASNQISFSYKESITPDVRTLSNSNEYIRSAQNYPSPIIPYPYLMKSLHCPHYTSTSPFLRDYSANVCNIDQRSLASSKNDTIANSNFWFGESMEKPRNIRSRHDSAVSDLTECCPSDVLREYQQMLEEALGYK